MEKGIKSEVRQDMMREFGNVRNKVGRINQTLVNHCLDCLKFILAKLEPESCHFEMRMTYMTMGVCDNYKTLNDIKCKISF